MQILQAYKFVLLQTGIRLTIASGSPTCRTTYQALMGLCWSLWHAVCMQLRLSNSEEPQSLFLFLHCSALLSYALTSCILVQVVESHSWLSAGLGAVPHLGLSQQSTSACVKMSCRSRGTSLCPLLCWPVTTLWSERRTGMHSILSSFFVVAWIGFAKCGS